MRSSRASKPRSPSSGLARQWPEVTAGWPAARWSLRDIDRLISFRWAAAGVAQRASGVDSTPLGTPDESYYGVVVHPSGPTTRAERPVVSHDLERACALLGPLEARIMRLVWSGEVPDRFIVHDVHHRFPDLAYTTLMTTLNRLAGKRLLVRQGVAGRRAHVYHRAGDPAAFLAAASRSEVDT